MLQRRSIFQAITGKLRIGKYQDNQVVKIGGQNNITGEFLWGQLIHNRNSKKKNTILGENWRRRVLDPILPNL